MLAPFRFHEPRTLGEASEVLLAHGPEAAAYAGGTELLVAMKQGVLRYRHLVNIKRAGADRIVYDAGTHRVAIGATATHRAVARDAEVRSRVPLLADVEARVANVRVRTVGTIGGNLCFAEPRSDLTTVLLLQDAAVVLTRRAASRTLPLASFLVDGYTTDLQAGELLETILVPALPAGAGAAYLKVAFYERPTAGVGVVLVGDPGGNSIAEARVAVGCVGPTPIRVPEAERALGGAPLRSGGFAAACVAAGAALAGRCAPVDDLYGSAAYKRHLASVLVRRAAEQARARLIGREQERE